MHIDPMTRDIIEGPSAWTGAELEPSAPYRRALTADEIDALIRAAERHLESGGAPIGFAAQWFPREGLESLLQWIEQQLERGPGFARVTGLPTQALSPDVRKAVFWGLCALVGTPVYQTAAGESLGEIKDETGGVALAGGGPGPVKTSRTIARSTGALRFHTDKTDVLCLLCSANGISGGISKVVSSVAIHNEIARRRPDLLEALYQPYWRMRPADEEGARDDKLFAMPVFSRGPQGQFTSQYSRTYVDLAQEVEGVPRLTHLQVEALDMLATVAEEVCLHIPFEAGDIQFMNQHVTYHGRTSYADQSSDESSTRLLYRIWLSTPFSRALPESHAVQWGSTGAGVLRGGALPGRSAVTAG